MLSNIIEQINNYTKLVENNEIKAEGWSCPKCKEKPLYFSPHEKKLRLFYVIVERLVHRIESLLMRWKCPLCDKTWTQYPEYALAYKRYTKEDLREFTSKYLEGDLMTYRKSVQKRGLAIFHEGIEGENEGKSLSPSTVWHWLGFTGSLLLLIADCLAMIKEKSPESGVFRKIFAVNSRKYRSDERREILQNSMKMLAVEEEYVKIFSRPIFFLQFATDGF